MNRRWLIGLSLLALGFSGCWLDEWLEPNRGTIGKNVPPLEKLQKAPSDVSTRVDSVGRQVLAANPDIARALIASDPELRRAASGDPNFYFSPQFVAIGVPGYALYHQRGDQVQVLVISAGLVNTCKTDSELAAMISSELARMVLEAQAQTQPNMRDRFNPDRSNELPPGSDTVGGRAPDQTDVALQASYEKANPRPRPRDFNAVDPTLLGRSYMANLNSRDQRFNPDDLAKVEPLVRQGNNNPNFQGVISTSPGSAPSSLAMPAQVGTR